MKLNYTISDNILSIHESWQINSLRGIALTLQRIRSEQAGTERPILRRTDRNIIEEWIVHNFFYDLHVLRAHTRTVDLEYPQRWYFRIAYHIVATFIATAFVAARSATLDVLLGSAAKIVGVGRSSRIIRRYSARCLSAFAVTSSICKRGSLISPWTLIESPRTFV